MVINPKCCIPTEGYYAVVRMDPETMLRAVNLDDQQALDEVRRMESKKYLVYLAMDLQLTMPHHQWSRYAISPIGATLRTEDAEKGLTPEMVIPIAPNTAHARGNKPVESETPFPFTNCFHWFGNETSVRIKVRREDPYDHTHGVYVPAREDGRLMDSFEDDRKRVVAFNDRKREAARSPMGDSSAGPCAKSKSRSTFGDDGSHFRTSSPPDPCADGQGPSTPPDLSDFEADDCTAIDPIFSHDLFGMNPVRGEGLFPILDCWLELEDHLTEDTIPSPVLFFEEAEAIKSILHRAYYRRKLLGEETPSSPPDISQTPAHTLSC